MTSLHPDPIQAQLYQILVALFGSDAQHLAPDADLMEAIALDSLTIVRLTVEINRAFDINFGVEAGDLDALQSVAQLARVVRERQLAVGAPA
jgi:acyl carrier protein